MELYEVKWGTTLGSTGLAHTFQPEVHERPNEVVYIRCGDTVGLVPFE